MPHETGIAVDLPRGLGVAYWPCRVSNGSLPPPMLAVRCVCYDRIIRESLDSVLWIEPLKSEWLSR